MTKLGWFHGRIVGPFCSMVLLLLLSNAEPGWAQQSGGEGVPLEPGDAIRVELSREEELSGEYPVDESGRVSLPLVGDWMVRGVPPDELERDLEAAYREQVRNQAINVTLLRRVRVLGEVNEPGLFHVDPTMTVADALALAGGATSNGNKEEVRIIRDGTEIRTDVYTAIGERVRSGDQIFVPQRSWFARNSGFVIGATLSAISILATQL